VVREGILIDTPYERMNKEQVTRIHQASMEILSDPGLMCFNKEAAEIFHGNGAEVETVSPQRPSMLAYQDSRETCNGCY